MIVMGIDPGLANMGLAIVDRRVSKIHVMWTLRTEPDQPLPQRLRQLADEVIRTAADYRVDVIVVEKPATIGTYRRKGDHGDGMLAQAKQSQAFFRAHGAVLLAASMTGVNVIEASSRITKAQRTQRLALLNGLPRRSTEHARDAAYLAAYATIIRSKAA